MVIILKRGYDKFGKLIVVLCCFQHRLWGEGDWREVWGEGDWRAVWGEGDWRETGEATVKQRLHLMVLVHHVQESGLYPKSNGVSLVATLLDLCFRKSSGCRVENGWKDHKNGGRETS